MKALAPSVLAVLAASCAPRVPEPAARWVTAAASEGARSWTLEPGRAPAAPLVLRGVLVPVGASTDQLGGCPAVAGARRTPLGTLRAVEAGRVVHVWAKARGPLGLELGEACVVAGPDAWARLDVPLDPAGAPLVLSDADVPGHRRGQTSPYVLVVRDDAEAPAEAPAPRPALGPKEVRVRWEFDRRACGESPGCVDATLHLEAPASATALSFRWPMHGWTQTTLAPNGLGVLSGGASGTWQLQPSLEADGTLKATATSGSDGACPDTQAAPCSDRVTRTLGKLPPGFTLVPDPEGTFPPLEDP